MKAVWGSRVVVVGCVLLVAFAGAGGAGAAEFRSEKSGFTVAVPAEWKRIPAQVVEEFAAASMKPEKRKLVTFEAAFQPAAQEEWFTYPYAVVQTLPYSSFGIHRQISEAEFGNVVKAMTGVDVNKALGSAASDEARGRLSGASVGTAQLDKERRRFEVPITMTVAGIGKVRGLLVGNFGRDSIVQMGFYTKAEEWDQQVAAGRSMIDSFRFDPDKAYSAAANSGGGSLPAGMGGIVAVIVGLVYFVMRKSRGKVG
jgi:hypothetical protein